MTSISFTAHGTTYTINAPEDLSLEAVVEHMRGLLVAAGYHPSSVAQHFNLEFDWSMTQPPEIH